jgi:hypothetical protein
MRKMNRLLYSDKTAKDTVYDTKHNSLFACVMRVTDLFVLMKLSLSVHNSYLNGQYTRVDITSQDIMANERNPNLDKLAKKV